MSAPVGPVAVAAHLAQRVAAVATGAADRWRGDADVRHLAAMTTLYAGQGFLQGLCFHAFFLLRAGGLAVSLHQQAALSLPIYAFSLKCLWAPLVDGLAFNVRTRRPLWVLACQLLLLLGFASLAATVSGALPAAAAAAGDDDDAISQATTSSPPAVVASSSSLVV